MEKIVSCKNKREVSVEKLRRYADWYWLKFGELRMCDCTHVRNKRSSILEVELRLEMGQ